MSDQRAYALILTILLSAGSLQAQDDGEFPIGAWFPGLFNTDQAEWNARLQLVDEANFNTIHAALETQNTAATNQIWMREAHRLGLNVQLYSWPQPEGWRGVEFWSQMFEAESSDFTHPIGDETTDGWSARVGTHSPGLLLDTPRGTTGGGIWIRGNTQNHYTHHVFWLSTDNTTGPDVELARVRVIITWRDGLGNNHIVTEEMGIRRSMFMAANTSECFPLISRMIPVDGQDDRLLVRYQIQWTGHGNLTVDTIRAHDAEGHELFRGDYDMDIEDELDDYYGDAVDPPWRFYLYDEPQWSEVHESMVYIDEIIQRVTATPDRPSGRKGVSAFNQRGVRHRPHQDDYMATVQPEELLVDYYPFATGTTAADIRNSLTNLKEWFGVARELAQGAGIPLWTCLQAHSWTNQRDVTREEIRVQANLALAHGATGIYYFMVSSYVNVNGTPIYNHNDLLGLLDRNYAPTDKWQEVTALNARLEALAPTYLALTSDEVFAGDAPADFVHSLSTTADYFLGTFTHTDGSRYLMVVNEDCRPTPATRTVTVTLDATDLQGDAYDYTLFDVYGDRRLPAGAGGSETHPEFEVTLGPGEGTLYRVDADLPVLASFGSSSYELIEGGDAVTGENPADVGKRVEVTVSLSAAPSERLEVPMVVTALSAADTDEERDYGVRDLSPSGGLVFTGGSASASFEIRARGDDDVEDETIVLSFGLLPAGVRAGTPSASTVTIHDTPNQPEGLTAAPGHGEVTLRWDAPDPENRGIRGWQYQVRPVSDTVFGPWKPMGLGGLTDQTVHQLTEHTVGNLPNGVKHHFRIRAYTRGYGVASAKASATPNLLVADAYRGAVLLRWTEPDRTDIASWQYQVREVPGSWGQWQPAGSGPSVRSQTVSGLRNGVGHRFKVQVVTSGGETAEIGSVVQATPQASLPLPPNEAPSKPEGEPAVSIAEHTTDTEEDYTSLDPEGTAIQWSLTGDDAAHLQVTAQGRLIFRDPAPE